MSAYVVVELEVTDPEVYEAYKKLAPPAIAAFGGKYLARGGFKETLEGVWNPERLVILEFESVERAKEWWNSDLYAKAKAMRQRSARTKLIVLEGLAEQPT